MGGVARGVLLHRRRRPRCRRSDPPPRRESGRELDVTDLRRSASGRPTDRSGPRSVWSTADCSWPSTTDGGPRRSSSRCRAGARLACFFRNVQAVMHFVYAVDGRVLAEFDPLLDRAPRTGVDPHCIDPRCRGCRSDCSRAEPSALTLLERLTGVRVVRSWLGRPNARWRCHRCRPSPVTPAR